jgi:hypothetical protein
MYVSSGAGAGRGHVPKPPPAALSGARSSILLLGSRLFVGASEKKNEKKNSYAYISKCLDTLYMCRHTSVARTAGVLDIAVFNMYSIFCIQYVRVLSC